MRHRLAFALFVALLLSACSDDSSTAPPDVDTSIHVSGTLAPDPTSWSIDQAAGPKRASLSWGDPGDVVLNLYDPLTVIAGASLESPLATTQVDPLLCGSVSLQCPILFSDVDISELALGLVSRVEDSRAVPVFVPTITGVFGVAQLTELKETGNDYDGALMWATSARAVEVLAGLAGVDAEQALGRGMLLGLLSTALPLQAVAGVTVTPARTDVITVYYPNDDYTALQTTTNVGGCFFAVAKEPGAAALTGWTAEGGGETWAEISALGTLPNSAFAFLWIAEP